MIILSNAKTTAGMVRTENQDSFGIKLGNNLFLVCDGMGGGAVGDYASKCVSDIILSLYDRITKKDCISVIGERFDSYDENVIKPIALIKIANKYLNNLTIKYSKLIGMGTTCVCVWFDKQTKLIHIYNVGDSRVYRIRNGIIQQMTKDHSKIEELVDVGKMTIEDTKTAEFQSMITRAVGISQTVRVDYKADMVKDGDVYVLCSDGLNGELTDSNINDIVNLYKPNPASISDNLILAANNAGGRDNTTVISVCIQDNFVAKKNINPDVFIQKEIVVAEDEDKNSSLKEDSIIYKFENIFSVPIPKLAIEKNMLRNPLFVAVLLVLLCICGVFVYTKINTVEEKSIVELTENISGIKLDVRTLSQDKVDEIKNVKDKVVKKQLLQYCLENFEQTLVPISDVFVSLSLGDRNKFRGLSGYEPLKIKLPKGTYSMTLSYPHYKILNSEFKLVDTLDVSLKSEGSLSNLFIVMVPEEVFDNI